MYDLEEFWAALLSKEPDQIRSAWASLAPEEAQSVRAHLERMSAGEAAGFSQVQSEAAAAALRVIGG